jgi:hypothetical protein
MGEKCVHGNTAGRLLLAVLVLLANDMVRAQSWQAEIGQASTTGVHRIDLSAELVGRSNGDLGDIRLIDGAGKEVPYVLDLARPVQATEQFIPFTITRNEIRKEQTVIELLRPEQHGDVVAIHLRVRNAVVDKRVLLTGSDDGRQWYIIKEDLLSVRGAEKGTSELRMIDLPRSDHLHYRITLNDSLTPPVQVLEAGWFLRTRSASEMSVIEELHWQQQDSTGLTRIVCTLPYRATVEQLSFSLEDGDTLFKRDAVIALWHTYTTGRGKKERTHREQRPIGALVLSSEDGNTITVNAFTADTFTINIRNGDDRPLRFTDWGAAQVQRSLLAQLEAGKDYRITTGDKKRRSPEYDLEHFRDRLKEPVAVLAHGALRTLPGNGHVVRPLFDPSKWWIWATLVVLLATVGFMALRMLRAEPPRTP